MPFQGTSPNKTFVRTDGTRTGSEVFQEAENLGIGIIAEDHDIHDQDMAEAINTSWQKDGSNQPTANIPMGNFKFTGHGPSASRSHLPLTSQVQDSAFNYGVTTGTANSYSVSLTPAITAYTDGLSVAFRTSVASSGSGATMLNVNGVGAKRIIKNGGVQIAANDFAANVIYEVRYNSQSEAFNIILDTVPVVAANSVSGTITTATNTEARARSVSTKALTPANATELVLRTGDTLSGGYTGSVVDDGTKSSGTYTPTPTGGNFRKIVNGGAFTLAKPTTTGDYTMIIQITNNGSAGAITVSGATKLTGEPFTTTNGDDFLVFITKINGFVHVHVQALQ